MPLRDRLLIAAVLPCTLAAVAWLPDTAVTRHHDEQAWIATGHAAWQHLADGDFSEAAWSDPRWGPFGARTPVLGKLVIGASVASSGLGDEAARLLPPGPFDWAVVERIEPSTQLLAAARRPLAWTAALAAVALFTMLRRLGYGTGLAALACALLVVRPLMLENGRLAMIDMPTLAMTLVALAAAAIPGSRHRNRVQWFGVGAACGLALACKLMGLIALIVAAAWCVMSGSRDRASAARTRAWRMLADLACLGMGAAVAFIASQPLLWHGPIAHTQRMFGLARRVAEYQAAPEERLDTAGERCASLLHFGLDVSDPASAWFGLPFAGAVVAAIALIALVRAALSRGAVDSRARLAAVWIGTVALLTVLSAPFAWRRWYLPMEPCWALLQAMGVCALVALPRSIRRWRAGPLQPAAPAG